MNGGDGVDTIWIVTAILAVAAIVFLTVGIQDEVGKHREKSEIVNENIP